MINKILFIVPSRNRSEKVKEFINSWRETQSGYSDLLLILDNDDEQLNQYPKDKDISIYVGVRVGFGKSINKGVELYPDYKYYGIGGDDHRFRTKSWDKIMIDKIEKEGGWGITYGNDLFQKKSLPTATVISANIIKALGYISPPNLIHLKIDRSHKVLGEAIGRLFYMPEIIIEHIHPSAKKTKWDKDYERVNSKEMNNHDGQVYEEWFKDLSLLANKIKELIKK